MIINNQRIADTTSTHTDGDAFLKSLLIL